MNILYIGAGFVGACSAAVSADSGHTTLVYDVDERKIKALGSEDHKQIESFLFEEGLAELLIRNTKNISFTMDYQSVENFLENCDAIFMCLPTPEIGETGESNLTYYNEAAKVLATALLKRNGGLQEKYIVIINKSTVPIDMVDRTEEIFSSAGVKHIGVVSNPEFLVEGKAILGSLRPDRVVVGAWNETDFAVMRSVYKRFVEAPNIGYIEVNPKEAAAGKLLANFYLFNKLAVCYDVIGRTCESFEGVQFEQLRKIMTADPRIGTWGFYDSLYAGGSCFIKDARSLTHQLQEVGQNPVIVSETSLANERQLKHFFDRAQSDAHIDWQGKNVVILGAAFKQDTNDIRNSPTVHLIEWLEAAGVASLGVQDPVATPMLRAVCSRFENITYATNAIPLFAADVIIVATDWQQFREVTDQLLTKKTEKPVLIMDGRRLFQHRFASLQEAGYDIVAVGSPFIKGK